MDYHEARSDPYGEYAEFAADSPADPPTPAHAAAPPSRGRWGADPGGAMTLWGGGQGPRDAGGRGAGGAGGAGTGSAGGAGPGRPGDRGPDAGDAGGPGTGSAGGPGPGRTGHRGPDAGDAGGPGPGRTGHRGPDAGEPGRGRARIGPVMANGYLDPVLNWYRRHARDLPWRQPTAAPCAVPLREITLQQTPAPPLLPPHLESPPR